MFRLDQRAHRGLGRAVGFGDESGVRFLLLLPASAEQRTDRFTGGIGEAVGEGEIGKRWHGGAFAALHNTVKIA